MTSVGSAATGLIVLRGNSGSGKSTVARALQDRHVRQLAVVSQDVLRRDVLRVQDKRDNPAVGLIDLVSRFALDSGMHVIIEGILCSEIYEEMLASLVADHRGSTRFFRFSLPFEETVRRHDSKGCNDFGERELRQWWRDHDVLPGCREQTIGPELDVNAVVDLITASLSW